MEEEVKADFRSAYVKYCTNGLSLCQVNYLLKIGASVEDALTATWNTEMFDHLKLKVSPLDKPRRINQ